MQIRKVKMSIKVNYWNISIEHYCHAEKKSFKCLCSAWNRREEAREIFIIKQKSCGSVKKVPEDDEEFFFVPRIGKEKIEWEKIKDEINPIKSCDIQQWVGNIQKRIRKLRRSNKIKNSFYLQSSFSEGEKSTSPRFLSARDRTREVFQWDRSDGDFRCLWRNREKICNKIK